MDDNVLISRLDGNFVGLEMRNINHNLEITIDNVRTTIRNLHSSKK